MLLDRLHGFDDHLLHVEFTEVQPTLPKRSKRSPRPYRTRGRVYEERLAGLFDLGDLDLVLAVFL